MNIPACLKHPESITSRVKETTKSRQANNTSCQKSIPTLRANKDNIAGTNSNTLTSKTCESLWREIFDIISTRRNNPSDHQHPSMITRGHHLRKKTRKYLRYSCTSKPTICFRLRMKEIRQTRKTKLILDVSGEVARILDNLQREIFSILRIP